MTSGPTGSPDSIRALLRSDPSVIEHGFRLFDFDLRAGPTTIIDAIGADRSGRLALIAVSNGDPDATLARLLDAHLWVADQRDLLGRMYAERGVKGDRPARGFLLAPSFTHAFLRRLSLVSVEVTPCLTRDVSDGNGARLTVIEPAAPIFGLDAVDGNAPANTNDRQPFWPDGVLPSEDLAARDALPSGPGISMASEVALPAESASGAGEPILPEEMPWPEAPEERFPWDLDADPSGAAPAPDGPATPGTFESLTAEELDEFDRFERQQRERGRRTS